MYKKAHQFRPLQIPLHPIDWFEDMFLRYGMKSVPQINITIKCLPQNLINFLANLKCLIYIFQFFI